VTNSERTCSLCWISKTLRALVIRISIFYSNLKIGFSNFIIQPCTILTLYIKNYNELKKLILSKKGFLLQYVFTNQLTFVPPSISRFCNFLHISGTPLKSRLRCISRVCPLVNLVQCKQSLTFQKDAPGMWILLWEAVEKIYSFLAMVRNSFQNHCYKAFFPPKMTALWRLKPSCSI